MTELLNKENKKHISKRHHSHKKQPKSQSQFKMILLEMLFFVRYYVDIIIDKIFGLYYDSQREFINPPDDGLVLESAVSLARKIRNRQVTCEQVVRAFIERIKQVNPIINAVVDNRFIDALDEARALDKDIQTGQIIDADFAAKPFLGVPFTAKESTSCKGLSQSFGLLCRKGRRAREDAECIRLMKEAGGILLGVTNIPQLNMWQETSNPVFGVTKNPYNSTRNVGGSSGGEASVLASCGIPISLGSDIGGSIRIPAFMCGVFGHKPTSDVINTRGLTFRTGTEKNTMVVAGNLARHSEDLIPIFKVLAGPNVDKLNLNTPVNIKKVKVYFVSDPKDPWVSPMRNDMKNVFNRVISFFNEISEREPESFTLDGLRYGGKLWRYWMTQEPLANFKYDLTDRQNEVNPYWEIIKKLFFFRNTYTMATIFNLANGSILPKEKENWAKEETQKLTKDLQEILGQTGVLIYPSAPFVASYHHSSFLRPWNFNYFAIWNALKFPVTQVPLGLNDEGLPMGVQVVAAPYQDHLCLAVAQELERQFGGYVTPFSNPRK